MREILFRAVDFQTSLIILNHKSAMSVNQRLFRYHREGGEQICSLRSAVCFANRFASPSGLLRKPLQRITIAMVLILVQISLISILSIAGEEPKEGENFLWIDLGKENKGLLLTQSEQADGVTEPATKGGVDCRENPWPYNGPGHNHMYFKIDDSFLVGGKHKAWIVMEYFDSAAAQQIDCQYDSNGAGPVNGAFRGAGDGAFIVLKPEGTDKWRVHIWYINKDGRFENRANGADFRFSSHGQGPIWINRVWFSLIEPPDPFDPEMPFGIGKAVEPAMKLAATWGNIKE